MITMTSTEEFMGTDAVAVAVTCHTDYLKYLPDQVAHVEMQTVKPAQRIIAYDGPYYQTRCKELRKLYPGWMVVGGDWKSPNPARNAALKIIHAEWAVFADADDFMHSGYVEEVCRQAEKSIDNIAILYADLQFSNGKHVKLPDTFDYWELRLTNFVSAASAWRVSSLHEVGGWPLTNCYDDWGLALKITARGWRAKKMTLPIMCRTHAGHRRDDAGKKEMSHKLTRSYGIVTLLAGRRECFQDWIDWLWNEDMPKETCIYILDNSKDKEFQKMARDQVETMGRNRNIPVMYLINNSKCDPDSHPLARHQHVPALYNHILPYVGRDMILTLEDDVVPPKGAFKQIIESFICGQKTGAVSAVYPSRTGENKIVGAFGDTCGNEPERDYWRNLLTTDDIDNAEELIDVKFIGGGFTLWHNALIKRFMPFRFLNWHGKASGWDSQLSRSIRNAGYKLFINPEIKCQHNYR